MAKLFDSLTEEHIAFIKEQKLFFVGSAAGGRDVNISPKGIFPFRVLGASEAACLDLYGSGNRTAEDIAEGSPVTVMFCSFDESPLILRLFCAGESVKPSDAKFDGLFANWEGMDKNGVRQIFLLKIKQVQSACGYGVPVFKYSGEKHVAEELTGYLPGPLSIAAGKVKDMAKKLFVLALLAALSACSTERLNIKADTNITKEKAARITKGKTTKAQVEAVFGEPMDRVLLPEGERYFYKDFNLRPLYVEFDKNGVVTNYEYDL
ncbi:MAG: outer membrane protein assembly factor BamE [Nitrospinae bacterium]|nr:outer membrane protein assembly factor BamE [Nitrospinota bacterium]